MPHEKHLKRSPRLPLRLPIGLIGQGLRFLPAGPLLFWQRYEWTGRQIILYLENLSGTVELEYRLRKYIFRCGGFAVRNEKFFDLCNYLPLLIASRAVGWNSPQRTQRAQTFFAPFAVFQLHRLKICNHS